MNPLDAAEKLRWLYDSTETQRFHARRRPIHEQTVGEHSARVALLLIFLHEQVLEDTISHEDNSILIRHAILHDLGEQDLGDIPSPSKRRLGISLTLDVLERQSVLNRGGLQVAALSEVMRNRFALADCVDGMLTCVRERELGNTTLNRVYDTYHSYTKELPMPPLGDELIRSVEILWEKANERK